MGSLHLYEFLLTEIASVIAKELFISQRAPPVFNGK
jgi:hypothetical protein